MGRSGNAISHSNTSHVIVKLVITPKMRGEYQYSNTSHVIVKPLRTRKLHQQRIDSNTSHVIVKRSWRCLENSDKKIQIHPML